MRKILPIVIIMLLASCKNIRHRDLSGNIPLMNTVATTELPEPKRDTVVKMSAPFAMNGMMCVWKHSFVRVDHGQSGYLDEVSMELRDNANRVLIEYTDSVRFEENYDYQTSNYFDVINERHLKDLNFDGFKDFEIYSYGSMPMTSATNIYFFDRAAKTFGSFEEVNGSVIEEADSINRILTMSSFDIYRTYLKKFHFDADGKLKFIEDISEEQIETADSINLKEVRYQKLVDSKVVESKVDTIPDE